MPYISSLAPVWPHWRRGWGMRCGGGVCQASSAAPLSPNQMAVNTLLQRGERDGLPWAFCFENFHGPFKILQNIVIWRVAAVPFCLVFLALLSSLMGPAMVFAWCLMVEELVEWCPAPWWCLVVEELVGWCPAPWCLMVEDVVFGALLQGASWWRAGWSGALLCGDGTREESQSQSDLQTHADVTSSVSCFTNV